MKKIFSIGLPAVILASLMTVTTVQVANAACVRNVAYGDKLNIRKGPGAGYGKKAAIPRTACGVHVFWGNSVGNWLDIRYGGVRGWVNRRFIGGGGGNPGGGLRCVSRVKVFKSGGPGSWFAPGWQKNQVRQQARSKWRSVVSNRYGYRYNKWYKARGKSAYCSRGPASSFVCKRSARPCR